MSSTLADQSQIPSDPHLFRNSLRDAIRFWEPRRILYNLLLAAVVFAWLGFTWPHFRPALHLNFLFLFIVLAAGANLCYCASYFVDIPLQITDLVSSWKSRRWILWTAGTLFAILLANYWIVDEIYPFVR